MVIVILAVTTTIMLAAGSAVNGTVHRQRMDESSGYGSSLHSRLKTEFDEVMRSLGLGCGLEARNFEASNGFV